MTGLYDRAVQDPADDQHMTTILWRHKALVALCVAVCLAAALAATLLQDETYEARATLQAGATDQRGGDASPEANQALARSYAEVLLSGSFLERVRPRIDGGRLTVRELQERLDAQAVTDTAVVRLEARGSSPAEARALADTVTANFLATLQQDATERVRRQQAQIDALVARLTGRIERLVAAGDSPSTVAQLRASRRALLEQGAGLVADGVAEGSSARRIGPPSASPDPVSPRPALNVIAALLLGLLLGTGLAWLRERRAPGFGTAGRAAEIADAPVLATIPLRRRVTEGDPTLSNAYDVLRANVMFQSHDRGLHTITVVGHNARVGKTSTVEGLAYAAARSGSSVAVVDGDLRMGTLSERMGHGNKRGLSDVVAGTKSLDDVLVELAPGVALLPAHAPVANPPTLLFRPRTREILAELRDRFDLVIVDSPPVGQLADGLVLASLSDGVLMVARSGVTSRDDLRAGVTEVRQTRTPIIGLVMFAAQSADGDYYNAAIAEAPSHPEDAALSR